MTVLKNMTLWLNWFMKFNRICLYPERNGCDSQEQRPMWKVVIKCGRRRRKRKEEEGGKEEDEGKEDEEEDEGEEEGCHWWLGEEVEGKITIIPHHSPLNFQNNTKSNKFHNLSLLRILVHYRKGCKLVYPLWGMIRRLFQNLETQKSYDPRIPSWAFTKTNWNVYLKILSVLSYSLEH